MLYIDKRDGRVINISESDLKYITASEIKNFVLYKDSFQGDKITNHENKDKVSKDVRGDGNRKRTGDVAGRKRSGNSN